MSRAVVKQVLNYLRVALEAFMGQLRELGITDIGKLLHSREFEDFVWEALQRRASVALGLNRLGMKPTCNQVAAWLALMSEDEKIRVMKDIVESYIRYLQVVKRAVEERGGERT